MHSVRRSAWGVVLLTAVTMAGCDEAPPQKAERVRTIKPYYVVEPAGGDLRHYSGTIIASNTSSLSFAVSGTVQAVKVRQGDRVTKGQVLATLDPAPFKLDVKAARAEVTTANAEYVNKKVHLDRQRTLFERDWVAKARLDQAVAAFEGAEGQLSLARSRLGLAERDLSNTRLTAPFDGIIAVRDVEPFVEISKGQAILQIDSKDTFEVELSIPDAVVGRLSIGTPVAIEASTVAGCGCTGRITEIGAKAGAANAVSVKATILQGSNGLLPGLAVEASMILSDEGGPGGYLVPLVAVAPGDDNASGYVFKYDAQNGVVKRTTVRGDGPASGNLIGVSEGVEAGDIIAAAGVSFLRDGQRVKLMGK